MENFIKLLKFKGGFKSKNFNKNFLIKVLKYAHIARRSRYEKKINEISRNIVEVLESISRNTI
jgi:hypothetical protein